MTGWIEKMDKGKVGQYRRYKLYAGILLLIVLLAVWSYP
jgi:hypothetical protein